MKRNVVAWAALVVSTAALLSSRGITKPVPASQEVPAEGQKAAKALSEAFEAVADYVRPSVVQISVESSGPRLIPGGRGNPNPGGPHGDVTPKDFEDMLKKFFPDFK